MRAVLGQQISVAAACVPLGCLVRLCGGTGFPRPRGAAADLASLGMLARGGPR
jgi:hypothetical protein